LFKRAGAILLSLVLMMGALVAAPRPVRADLNQADYQSAADQLNKYGLVQGDERGYRFYAQITRAEMAKLLIYSLGQQSQATKYAGRGTFRDTNGHWAEGIVTLAKLNGIMKGYPDGSFDPEAALTYAEVITALARLAGLPGSDMPWPRTYLGPAQEAGIVPDGMELYSRLDQPAARGDVFVLLWRTLTAVKNQKGENLLRMYLDRGAPVLTVDPQPTETTDLALTVSGTAQGADQVLVNGTAVTPIHSYFQATVSLRLGPNTIRVQALDDAGNVKEQVLQVNRKQSPASAIALTGPAKVAAGETAGFSISVKDQNGQELTDRKSVQATVEPADLGDFDAATGTFAAGTKPGIGTITVKSGTSQTSVNVAVVPAPLDRLTIDPPLAALAARQSIIFTARGTDKYGNEVAVSNVNWTAGAGTVSQTGVYVAPEIAAPCTVTATADGKVATAQVQPPNYKAKSVRLNQPTTTLKANGAGQLTLTATVLDENGNTMTDYAGNLTITSSDANVAAPDPQTVPVTRGVAQITVQAGRAPGKATITASTNLASQGSAVVTVTPQRFQSVRLAGYPVPGSTNLYPTGYVEAVALDEDGYPMYQPLAQTVVVAVALPALLSSVPGTPNNLGAWFVQNDLPAANLAIGDIDPESGTVRSRTHINYTPGVGTLLIQGTVQPPSMAWVRVTAGALNADQVGRPARVAIEPIADAAAGTDQYVYVVLLDTAGVRVTRDNALVGYSVRLRDEDGVTYSPDAVDAGIGRYRFTVNHPEAGSHTYTATLQPGGASVTSVGQVVADSPDHVKLTITPEIVHADNTSQVTLRAELLDAHDNRITGRRYQATFMASTHNGVIKPFDPVVVTTSGGVAEYKATASTVVGADDVRVIVTNPDGDDWNATATVTTRGTAERLAISYGDNNRNGAEDSGDYTGRVGQNMIVYVDVLDSAGGKATFDKGRSVSLTVRNMQNGQEKLLSTVSTNEGRATFTLARTEAVSFALKAQSTGLTPAYTEGYGGSVPDVVLRPAQAATVKVDADLKLLRPGGFASYSVIQAQLVDTAGNPTPNQTGRAITVTLEIPAETGGAITHGTFRLGNAPDGTPVLKQSVDIPAGAVLSTPAYFFPGTVTGSKTVTWSTLDGAKGSFPISTTTATTTPKLNVETDTAVAAPLADVDPSVDGQTVVVTVQDANGIRMSNTDGIVTIKTLNDDTRVIAYWDSEGWHPLDHSSGEYPPESVVPVYRGQAKFRVQASTSGMKTYRISYGPMPNGPALTQQVYGLFLAPLP
jgi:hypothetical protein